MARLQSEYDIHGNQVSQWKRELLAGAAEIFGHQRERDEQRQQQLVEEPYQQIGQLKVEVDWLKKESGMER